jgi:small subunit ribosomal protein S6
MAQTQTAANRAREYETIYIMRPDVARDAAAKVAGRVDEVVTREGGRMTLVETWGRRVLAYPVHKHKRGVYVFVKYLGGGALVNELERNLRMLDDVIKYQTVQTGIDIDAAGVEINPDNVKFEAIEPPTPEEETDISLERELGLEEGPEAPILRDETFLDEEEEVLAQVAADDEDES